MTKILTTDGTTCLFKNSQASEQSEILRYSVSDYLDPGTWDTSISEEEQICLTRFFDWADNSNRFGYSHCYTRIKEQLLSILTIHGMEHWHYLLEIGCGSLRFAKHVANYLKPYHYIGIDPDDCLHDFASPELPILVKKAKIEDVKLHAEKFEFVVAFSVFTHMTPVQIYTTLWKVKEGLRPGGQFFATFTDSSDTRNVVSGIVCDRPYPLFSCFPREMFQLFATEIGFEYEFIGDWDCPGNPIGAQQLVHFTKDKTC